MDKSKVREFNFRVPRYASNLGFTVSISRSGAEILLAGVAQEISERGLTGSVAGELCEGERVELSLSSPYMQQEFGIPAIVHTRSAGVYAFEFVPSASQRQVIRSVCKQFAPGGR